MLFIQLITALMHYTCIVPLPGLANWYAFLEQSFLSMSSHGCDNVLLSRALNSRYGPEFDLSISEKLLRPSRHV